MTSGSLAVAYDVTATLTGRTGIARYVTELAGALEREGVVLHRFAVGRSAQTPPPMTRRIRIPVRLLAPWWRLVPWPDATQVAGGGEIVHATGLLIAPARRPLVVTVHDLAALTHPDLHSARQVAQARALVPRLAEAAAILAVSTATAEALAESGADPSRIIVSPLGRASLPPPQAVPGLPARFVLTVGETAPRKRYGVVLEALSRLPAVKLVMAGPAATEEARLRSRARALGLTERVIRLGHVDGGALAALYGDAEALCFPSVAEGFGLPVLEAMARGLPVIVRDIAPLRELAADAALYVSGEDPAAWAEAIDTAMNDDAERRRLIAAGRRRAAAFTWERTARATLDAYHRALGSPRSGGGPGPGS